MELPGSVATATSSIARRHRSARASYQAKEFVAGFVPPDYLVHGLIQEGFLYSLTGATGSGKTSLTLRLVASIALEKAFAGRKTKQRRVLYLAAENPEDVRMRWIALAQQMDFEVTEAEVYFIEGVFRISEMADQNQGRGDPVGWRVWSCRGRHRPGLL